MSWFWAHLLESKGIVRNLITPEAETNRHIHPRIVQFIEWEGYYYDLQNISIAISFVLIIYLFI